MTDKKTDEEIKFSDQSGEEKQESPIIPKEERILRTQAYDKSVSDLVKMIDEKDILLDPDYQRNYIWDDKKASLLIESILLNVPIPVIYVAEDKESRWAVVDGLQRLNSLKRFIENDFKLTGLEVLHELNKQTYSKLNPTAQRILRNGIIRIIVITQESHPEIKYDIFLRLNRGSISLNEQELRNCMYRGNLNDLLHDLRKTPQFLQCLGLPQPHKRFLDAEMILRFFALSKAYNSTTKKLENYSGKMKTFLNDYMDVHKDISTKDAEELKTRFQETISKVFYIFDKNAFRKLNSDDQWDTRLNRALMDTILLSFEKFSIKTLKAKKAEILTLYKQLPEHDQTFNDAINYGTSDTKKLEYRISTWLDKMSEKMEK